MSLWFELFHSSLLARPQADLFVNDVSREQWLRRAFAEQFGFTHWKNEFFWVPKRVSEGDIIGIVERLTSRDEHRPPDQGEGEIVGKVWQGARVLIDPTSHDLGQRVAFEVDQEIGLPHAVLGSLVAHLNSDGSAPYQIELKPVFDPSTFWQFAEEHGNVLKRITFDFVLPNMWGARTSLDSELRATREKTGAQKVKVSLESQSGVRADTQKVRVGIAYSERGGASVTATALNGDPYSSGKKIKKTEIKADEAEGSDSVSAWTKLAARILGRE
jgi:hypothetical protein